MTEAPVDSGNDGDQSQEDFDQVLAAKEAEEEADLDSESFENDENDVDDGEEKAATASVEGKAENVFFEELLSQPEPDRPETDALRSRLALTAPETVETDFAESDPAERTASTASTSTRKTRTTTRTGFSFVPGLRPTTTGRWSTTLKP